MKKRVLAIAATAMATMMMASPVMAQDFKIGNGKVVYQNA